MSLWELLILAVGLSMDAFAVSVCKGLAMQEASWRKALVPGIWFGGFQALMPLIGFFLGSQFQSKVTAFGHWIAFALLLLIGLNMIRKASPEADDAGAELDAKTMFLLAVATSIDALAVGVSLAFLQVHILAAVLFIGCVTCLLSMAGVKVGVVFGARFKKQAELAGGIILVLLGIKILLEQLGIVLF